MRRIKINIRYEEESTAAISHLRSQGCCTWKKKKRAEAGAISERGEDGERGAGEGDMVQPYMALVDVTGNSRFAMLAKGKAPVEADGGCCLKRRPVRAAMLEVLLATKPITSASTSMVTPRCR